MRVVTTVVLAIMASACASTSPVAPQGAEASGGTEDKVTQVHCSNDAPTGSHFKKRRCVTKEQAKQEASAGRQMIDGISGQAAGQPPRER